MNSINRNQPEQNHLDLSGKDAVAKIQELVKQSPVCFFCTALETNKPFQTRPMSVQKVDDDGFLWFLSANDSEHDRELARSPYTQLLFKGSEHSDFLSLWGTATVGYDRQKIHELYEPIMKTWFTEGEDDRRISVIKFSPVQGYYWDTKHNRAVVFAKMIAGAITGKTLDDSIEGRLDVH